MSVLKKVDMNFTNSVSTFYSLYYLSSHSFIFFWRSFAVHSFLSTMQYLAFFSVALCGILQLAAAQPGTDVTVTATLTRTNYVCPCDENTSSEKSWSDWQSYVSTSSEAGTSTSATQSESTSTQTMTTLSSTGTTSQSSASGTSITESVTSVSSRHKLPDLSDILQMTSSITTASLTV